MLADYGYLSEPGISIYKIDVADKNFHFGMMGGQSGS